MARPRIYLYETVVWEISGLDAAKLARLLQR